MGKNNNKEVKVVAQAKQGKEAAAVDVDNISAEDDEEEDEGPEQSLDDFLNNDGPAAGGEMPKPKKPA